MRYAKRSVQIDGRVYNPGDIIPASVTDEAAKAAHAFDDDGVAEINLPADTLDADDTETQPDPDEETFDVEVPGAALLMSSESAPDTTATTPDAQPAASSEAQTVETTRKGNKGRGAK